MLLDCILFWSACKSIARPLTRWQTNMRLPPCHSWRVPKQVETIVVESELWWARLNKCPLDKDANVFLRHQTVFTLFRFNFALKMLGKFILDSFGRVCGGFFCNSITLYACSIFALAQAISCQNRVWHQCQFERTSHVNGALFKYGMHPHPFLGSKLWREGVNISPHVLGCDVFFKIQYWALPSVSERATAVKHSVRN